MLQKLIVYGLSLIILALFASPASAQTLIPVPTTVSPTSPIYTDLLVHNMFHTFSCLAVGQSVIGQPCLTYLKGVPVLSQVNLQGGTLGALTGVIGLMYQNPPVRTYESLASLGETLGIVKEAKAQGVVGSGAGVLQPIQTLWQVSRNISYVIMIIIFVVIGLMVMFRQRINPQTVITAQAAIPGLVIGLILITFSYFLAGLISDTAFLGTNLVGAYFSAVKGQPNQPENLVEKISPKSVLHIFSGFIDKAEGGQIEQVITSFLNSAGGNVTFWLKTFAAIIAFQFGAQLGGAIPIYGPIFSLIAGGVASFATAAWTSQILGGVFWFVVMAILIYSMLRLLMRLVNNYLTIIFLTITAPFQFLFSALPGRQGIATAWILNMLANVLAFPAVLAVLYFVAFLLGQNVDPFTISDSSQIQNSSFVPAVYAQGKIDIVSNTTFPLLGGMDLGFIKILLAFGVLVAIPAIPDIVIRAVGKASEAGQLIGQEISGGMGAGRGYTGRFQQGLGAIGTSAAGLAPQGVWVQDVALGGGKFGWRQLYVGYAGARPGGAALFKKLFGRG